jgi:KpsF/GutQ family protein
MGRVIVSGVGKSGHIGRKFAATLASTGTPAYFVHAAEAAHGDLGMITADDVLIALSYSGSGEELLKIVPLIKRQGARLIAITGNPDSPLAREADVHLDGAVREEACPLNLAPTASTTAALALSDALAVALLDARGFGADDFARSHPGGALGRRLLTHVSDVMRSGPAVPRVAETALLADALMEMTRAGMGMTAIIGDGDERPHHRHLHRRRPAPLPRQRLQLQHRPRGRRDEPRPQDDPPRGPGRRGRRDDGAPAHQPAPGGRPRRPPGRRPQPPRPHAREGHLMLRQGTHA